MSLSNDFHYIFSRAQQSVLQVFRKELQPLKITPMQYSFLICLMQDNGCSPAYLANYFGLESSTVTGILDRLELKNLVVREADPYDRRSLHINVTDKGWRLCNDMLEASAHANAIIEARVGKENVPELKKLLGKVYEKL